jgi:hypothetical protein
VNVTIPPAGPRQPRTDRGTHPQAAGFKRYVPDARMERSAPNEGFRRFQLVAAYLRRP